MAYIVKDAPIPISTKSKKGSKYPFDKIQPGESFMVANKNNMPPGEKVEDAATLGNMTTHCSRHNTKIMPDCYFKCRIYPEDTKWIQVWRIS